MGKPAKNGGFNGDFCLRTKRARIARGFSQAEMADALQVEEDTYSKYERRTPLPHRYIPRFCLICGISLEELFAMRKPPKVVAKSDRITA